MKERVVTNALIQEEVVNRLRTALLRFCNEVHSGAEG